MGQALLIILAVRQTTTTGRFHLFIHCGDHISHRNITGFAAQTVTTTRPTGGVDQPLFAQLGKQLFQVGKGNTLTLRNIGKRDGAILIM